MYNTSQGTRGIPNKSDSEQKYNYFRFSSPKAATDVGVSSSELHNLILFYEMVTAGFGVLSKSTGFYPPSDRIVKINAWTLESGTWRQVLQWTNILPTVDAEGTRGSSQVVPQNPLPVMISTEQPVANISIPNSFTTAPFVLYATPPNPT